MRVLGAQPWQEGPYWTGLNDRNTEGSYAWNGADYMYDGTAMPWAPGQPATEHRDNDCVAMHEDGLHDETCSSYNKHFYVCVAFIQGACADGPCGEGRCINADNDEGYVCDCTDTGMSYEERVARREAEIEGLKQAPPPSGLSRFRNFFLRPELQDSRSSDVECTTHWAFQIQEIFAPFRASESQASECTDTLRSLLPPTSP